MWQKVPTAWNEIHHPQAQIQTSSHLASGKFSSPPWPWEKPADTWRLPLKVSCLFFQTHKLPVRSVSLFYPGDIKYLSPIFMKVPLQALATGQVAFLSPGNPWNHLLDYSIGDKLEVKAAACTLSCSCWSRVGVGYQTPKNSLFFHHRGNWGKKVNMAPSTHTSVMGHWVGGSPKCVISSRKRPKGPGFPPPEPGLVKNIKLREAGGA